MKKIISIDLERVKKDAVRLMLKSLNPTITMIESRKTSDQAITKLMANMPSDFYADLLAIALAEKAEMILLSDQTKNTDNERLKTFLHGDDDNESL